MNNKSDRGAVHLVCGPTGAGKTTYAMKLSEEFEAVRFSIDEWMSALFWMDTPYPLEAAWSIERVERCSAQIWRTARDICMQGVPVVLDLGLGRAAARAKYFALAVEAGLSARLYVVELPVEERWRRVQERNGSKCETYQLPFDVTREMFDFVETMWEPPSDEEIAGRNGTRVRS
jgi:predicted kinase